MRSLARIWTLAAALLVTAGLQAEEPATNGEPTDATIVEQPAAPPSKQIEQLTAAIRKSVVVVTFTGRDGRHQGLGSGFVVSPDGLIATNHHVISEARPIAVTFADGQRFDVTAVHASDRVLDLAVLKIDAHDLAPLRLGDSEKLKQGQAVLALGNPHGLTHSVVTGVVSSVRQIDNRPMIQLAMPIEPGNSGGPLVDLDGHVVGVVTMKSLVTPNLGFALTSGALKPLLEKPNPIPMSRWLTIGTLDPHEWKPVLGGHWRRRAGRLFVDGLGEGFGGRAVMPVPAAAARATL